MNNLKLLTLLLIIAIIIGIIPKFALAEETLPEPSEKQGFLQPIEQKTEVPEGYTGIYTAEDMDNIRNNLSGKYILMADIDLSPLGYWEPIGRCETFIKNIYDEHMNIIDVDYIDNEPFCGIFDGNGHVLSGMNIKKEYELTDTAFHSVGLFASAENCTITNLGIIDSTVFASHLIRLYAAAIVGRQYQNVCIENCFSDTRITAVGCDVFAAGITSSWNDRHGIIRNCVNYGDIKVELNFDTERLNGCLPEPYDYLWPNITALGIGFGEIIESSVNYGDITAEISGNHRKIMGIDTAGIGGFSIYDCTNYGSIKSSISKSFESDIIIAFNHLMSGGIGVNGCQIIINCNNFGDICAEINDSNISPPDVFAGGIIGLAEYCDVAGCMNVGTVSAYCGTDGSVNVGGIAGALSIYNYKGSVKESCNYGRVSAIGVSVTAGGIIGSVDIFHTEEICHGYINDFFNIGDIVAQGSNKTWSGGIFGSLSYAVINDKSSFNISNMYNIGIIGSSLQDNIGSIAGCIRFQPNTNAKFSIKNAYYSSCDVNEFGRIESGDITCNRITELSIEQMHDKTSYKGFNFVNVWEFDTKTNNEYPGLRSITGNFNQMNLGDVNADRRINTQDAVQVLRQCACMITLDNTQKELADVNCDFTVTTADAVLILKYVAGMITEF